MMHQLLISLGSNYESEEHIPRAIERLYSELRVLRKSSIVQTQPVDFPYPSADFTNVLLLAETELNRAEVISLLHQIEKEEGRDRELPQYVSLDADLITWDNIVLKPKDMARPYFASLLGELQE